VAGVADGEIPVGKEPQPVRKVDGERQESRLSRTGREEPDRPLVGEGDRSVGQDREWTHARRPGAR
jgi:hypothetical protein